MRIVVLSFPITDHRGLTFTVMVYKCLDIEFEQSHCVWLLGGKWDMFGIPFTEQADEEGKDDVQSTTQGQSSDNFRTGM